MFRNEDVFPTRALRERLKSAGALSANRKMRLRVLLRSGFYVKKKSAFCANAHSIKFRSIKMQRMFETKRSLATLASAQKIANFLNGTENDLTIQKTRGVWQDNVRWLRRLVNNDHQTQAKRTYLYRA